MLMLLVRPQHATGIPRSRSQTRLIARVEGSGSLFFAEFLHQLQVGLELGKQLCGTDKRGIVPKMWEPYRNSWQSYVPTRWRILSPNSLANPVLPTRLDIAPHSPPSPN